MGLFFLGEDFHAPGFPARGASSVPWKAGAPSSAETHALGVCKTEG